MIRLNETQEQAFGRIVKANAVGAVVQAIEAHRSLVQGQYEQSRELLVVSGQGRDQALTLRGRIQALDDVIDLFQRQTS